LFGGGNVVKKVILWKLLIVIFVIHLPVRIYAAVGGISTVDSADLPPLFVPPLILRKW
jgi:hypothetical protein